jgi:sulfur transfer complex TusBCD TusB component (DsrH family)
MDQENVVFIHNGIYSAIKKNEMLSFASKWMELENIILKEVSQAQNTKNRMFSLICRP